MIIYLDASGFAKVFVDEPHSEAVRSWVSGADLCCSSRVTVVELHAVVARKQRDQRLADEWAESILARIDRAWRDVSELELDERRAAELAFRHRLRALDAVHLAAMLTLRDERPHAAIAVASFDKELNDAAAAEGLTVLSPEPS